MLITTISRFGRSIRREGGPVSVEGKQLIEMIPGGFTAASEYEVRYTYANGVVHDCRSTTGSEWHGGVKDASKQQHGIKFIGSDGWIWVTRGQIKAGDRDLLTQKLPAGAKRVYESRDHMGNFVDCVRTRKPTICPAEVGHRSASMCHLGVDVDPPWPQVAMGPKEGRVRRRCGCEQLCLATDAEAV